MRCMLAFVLVCLLALGVNGVRDISECPPIAPHPPATSVKELRFDDIKIIGALGDSITAAFAMDSIPAERRGKSWSIGGDPDAKTLATFFKHYSPQLWGQSFGMHLPEVCMPFFCPPGQYQPELDQLNAAQSGAFIQNVHTQVQYWKTMLQKNPNIDMEKDWKLLTILIGANNLCRVCDANYDIWSDAQAFEDQLKSLIVQLQEIPRLFVNLVSIFNISQVFDKSKDVLYCRTVHDILGMVECECVFPWLNGDKYREKVDAAAQMYRQRMEKVVQATPVTDSFAVVLQPMFSDMEIPSIDYLSPLDCFHPSTLAHEQMAIALWNTMQLPAHLKPRKVSFPQELKCPTNDTLLYVV